jgi:hypothetical protein
MTSNVFVTLICYIGISSIHSVPAEAQADLPVSIAAGTHALTVPWYPDPVANRFNPAFQVGTDRTWKAGNHWRLYYGVSLGFFRHHWWMTGVSIVPELGVGRRLPAGFRADVSLGLGYMHYFWRRKTLELKNGKYVEARNWGKPSAVLPLSVTLGHRGGSDQPVKITPFVSTRWAAQGMFLDEVPAMTHFSLLGGVRIERGSGEPGGRM